MKNVDRFSQHLGAGQGKLDLCQQSQSLLFYLFSAHQLGLVYRAQMNHSMTGQKLKRYAASKPKCSAFGACVSHAVMSASLQPHGL